MPPLRPQALFRHSHRRLTRQVFSIISRTRPGILSLQRVQFTPIERISALSVAANLLSFFAAAFLEALTCCSSWEHFLAKSTHRRGSQAARRLNSDLHWVIWH